MSLDTEISTYELLSSLLSNIVQYQVSDLGTPQSLLLHILTTAIEDPRTLAYDFVSSISSTTKYFSPKEDEEKLSQKSQLIFLSLENLFFNLYSKLKTSETVKLQESLYHSHASISFSILNLDTTKQVIHHTQFTTFLQCLLGDQNFFESLLKFIPKTTKPQLSQQVAFQVKNFISTLEYIVEKEGIDSNTFMQKRAKFEQYARIAPEKLPIKESIKEINKVVFSGNVTKLVKLISLQKDRQSFEMSLLRLFNYYRRNVSNPKHFDQYAINGQEVIQKCVTTYISSKARTGKDSLFRENRSTEPLLDFILAYMTFNFLPVLRIFDQFVEKYLLPYAKLDSAEFYSNFNTQGLPQGKQFLESLAVEFKDFLRRVYSAINSAGFSDSVSASGPVKTLIFLRFFLNPEIRTLIQKPGVAKQNQEDFMKVCNYFKDLFYESSLKKYSYIPEFSQCYNQLNSIFDDILLKKRAFKSEVVIPNYLKFYITKPLLRYDYTIIKQTIDEENAKDYDEDFEDDSFIDEKLERSSPPQNKLPINIQTNITKPPEKNANTGSNLKKILAGEESSGSIDEDFLHMPNQRNVKEEIKQDEYPGRTKEIPPWEIETRVSNTQQQVKKEDSRKIDSEVFEEEESMGYMNNSMKQQQQVQEDRSGYMNNSIRQQQQIQEDYNRNKSIDRLEVPQTRVNDSRIKEGSRLGNSMMGREEESMIEKIERESEMRITMAEKEHNKEKTMLMNRLGVLEEKYSLLLDTIGRVSPGKTHYTDKENMRDSQGKERNQEREERKRNKKDDSFYQLHKEIMEGRDEALQAEVDYVMHKKINFPGGI